MDIFLPSQFEAIGIFRAVRSNLGDLTEIPDSVDFNFSYLRFIRPSGIVFLANLTTHLASKGVKVTYSGINSDNQAIRFLDDSRFFERHLGAPLSQIARPRKTTIPLISIANDEALGWLDNTLLPWIVDVATVPVGALGEFRTCVAEIINNIRDHADAENSSIFAQWYPNEKRLIISIGDIGAGIPTTVRRMEPDLSDSEAIVRAFEDGFSAKSIPTNRGAGLYYLLQNVVGNLGGKLQVTSCTGGVAFGEGSNILNGMPYNFEGYCPGTLIDIEVRTDLFIEDDEEDIDFGGEISWSSLFQN